MALAERETLLQQNYQLQHKLAEYFRKKKNDERQDYDKNVTDQEQRYLKYMGMMHALKTLQCAIFFPFFAVCVCLCLSVCLSVCVSFTQFLLLLFVRMVLLERLSMNLVGRSFAY